MTRDRSGSIKNLWVLASVSITSGLVLLTAAGGFVLIPYLEANAPSGGLWNAICSAAGLIRTASAVHPIEPTYKVSEVVLTPGMLRNRDPESIGRGATLAQRCAICHGPSGISRADSPNLAGQYAAVVYKELRDFKSGARVNAVMTPFALPLDNQEMIDLAAYYSYLPRLPGYHPPQSVPAPKIVLDGAPMRNIANCGSCHGAIDNKTGSPWLEGQPSAYIKAQLEAFRDGSRHNDISEQMRNIARNLTPKEIDEVAAYYSSQPTVQ